MNQLYPQSLFLPIFPLCWWALYELFLFSASAVKRFCKHSFITLWRTFIVQSYSSYNQNGTYFLISNPCCSLLCFCNGSEEATCKAQLHRQKYLDYWCFFGNWRVFGLRAQSTRRVFNNQRKKCKVAGKSERQLPSKGECQDCETWYDRLRSRENCDLKCDWWFIKVREEAGHCDLECWCVNEMRVQRLWL